MRNMFLTLATIVAIGAFAGAASACPYSGHADTKEEAKPVVIGS